MIFYKACSEIICLLIMIRKWQEMWDGEVKGHHLYNIQQHVGNGRKNVGSRKEDTIISRLHIGHKALNHLVLKSLELSRDCGTCAIKLCSIRKRTNSTNRELLLNRKCDSTKERLSTV